MAATLSAFSAAGSSPRVRGTPPETWMRSRCTRFIPASAGNAAESGSSCCQPTVHPRECGERCAPRASDRMGAGSSPRVRGTRRRNTRRRARCRFIPASAGNAYRLVPGRGDCAVHPRECGERVSGERAKVHRAGSSPRVRGTRSSARSGEERSWFIPASAGNASLPRPRKRAPSVHPRECGERQANIAAYARSGGSSPRVRGTPRRRTAHVLPRRFIPASAGNACDTPCRSHALTVHPRECGERVLAIVDARDMRGSSPRVRGTLSQWYFRAWRNRFIPASAGNAGRASCR